jgi:hypothetical protein
MVTLMQRSSLRNSMSNFMPKSFMRLTPALFLVKSANSLCDYFFEPKVTNLLTKWSFGEKASWQNGLALLRKNGIVTKLFSFVNNGREK